MSRLRAGWKSFASLSTGNQIALVLAGALGAALVIILSPVLVSIWLGSLLISRARPQTARQMEARLSILTAPRPSPGSR